MSSGDAQHIRHAIAVWEKTGGIEIAARATRHHARRHTEIFRRQLNGEILEIEDGQAVEANRRGTIVRAPVEGESNLENYAARTRRIRGTVAPVCVERADPIGDDCHHLATIQIATRRRRGRIATHAGAAGACVIAGPREVDHASLEFGHAIFQPHTQDVRGSACEAAQVGLRGVRGAPTQLGSNRRVHGGASGQGT